MMNIANTFFFFTGWFFNFAGYFACRETVHPELLYES